MTSAKLATAMAMALITAAAYAPEADAQEAIRIDGSTGTAPLVAAIGEGFTAKSKIRRRNRHGIRHQGAL